LGQRNLRDLSIEGAGQIVSGRVQRRMRDGHAARLSVDDSRTMQRSLEKLRRTWPPDFFGARPLRDQELRALDRDLIEHMFQLLGDVFDDAWEAVQKGVIHARMGDVTTDGASDIKFALFSERMFWNGYALVLEDCVAEEYRQVVNDAPAFPGLIGLIQSAAIPPLHYLRALPPSVLSLKDLMAQERTALGLVKASAESGAARESVDKGVAGLLSARQGSVDRTSQLVVEPSAKHALIRSPNYRDMVAVHRSDEIGLLIDIGASIDIEIEDFLGAAYEVAGVKMSGVQVDGWSRGDLT